MDTGYLILFGCALGLIAFLIWMLWTIQDRTESDEKDKIRGHCPVCGMGLRKGERIRSDQVEIGDIEVQTKIKGCPYCLGPGANRKRACPVCKKKLAMDQVILAVSDPRVDRKKLGIRGCQQCYPQGF